MKRFLIIPAILLTFSFSLYAEPEVRIGDSAAEVVQLMGEPTSYMKMGGIEYLRYNRGLVTLESNRVVSSTLETEEGYAARKALELETRKKEAEQKKVDAAARYAEGLSLKDKMLESSEYLIASADQKVTWWRNFSKKYPGVDIRDPYLVALEQYQVDKKKAEEIAAYELRIKSLEQKLDSTEWAKKEAEQKAKDANTGWPQQTVQVRQVVPYYYQPLIIKKHHRTPTTPTCYVTKNRPTTRVTGTGGGVSIIGSSSSMGVNGRISSGSSKTSSIYNQLIW